MILIALRLQKKMSATKINFTVTTFYSFGFSTFNGTSHTHFPRRQPILHFSPLISKICFIVVRQTENIFQFRIFVERIVFSILFDIKRKKKKQNRKSIL